MIAYVGHAAGGIHHHFAEEVDDSREVTKGEAVLAEFEQQAGFGIGKPIVAVLLIRADAVLGGDGLGIGKAGQRIVPAETVGGEGEQHTAHVGIEDVAGGEARDVLRLERIGQVEALGEIFEVEAGEGGIGTAFYVGQAQRGAALEHVRPSGAATEIDGKELRRHTTPFGLVGKQWLDVGRG